MEGTDWLLVVRRSRSLPVVILDAEVFFDLLDEVLRGRRKDFDFDCRISNCRAITHQVNHDYCPAHKRILQDIESRVAGRVFELNGEAERPVCFLDKGGKDGKK